MSRTRADSLSDRLERHGRSRWQDANDSPAASARAAAFSGLGNRALLAMLRSGQLQRKARVSEPADAAERAADRAADAVLAGGRPVALSTERAAREIRRVPSADRERAGFGPVAAPAARATPVSAAPEPRGEDVLGGLDAGRGLDERTRALMETRFGESFTEVRVHTGHRAGEAADALRSRAFTVGENTVFAEGEFAPETSEGRRLLAHELAHVVQQRRTVGAVGDERQTEREAQDAAREVLGGGTPSIRERAAPGSIQRSLKELPTDAEGSWKYMDPTIDWIISVDGYRVVKIPGLEAGDKPNPRAWEDPDTNLLYVDPRSSAISSKIGNGRWSDVILTSGYPITRPPPPKPAPKPTPKPKAVPAPRQPKPKPEVPRSPEAEPPAQEVPEVVITAEEAAAEPAAPAERDPRPIAEQVVTALADDPAKAAALAPQLSDAELAQFDAKDRVQLLDAIGLSAYGGLDIQTTLRVLQTTPESQQRDLLEGLVAHDGKVLAALRASVLPRDRAALETGLLRLQMAVDFRSGMIGVNPNMFDQLGARGFARPVWSTSAPFWARDLQFRREPNGDWTFQAPGQAPVLVEGAMTRWLRAERMNERIASFEARNLSPQGKVDRLKELAENRWTGPGDEDRIINILRYTAADEAPLVLNALKTTQSGGMPLIDKLDSAVDWDNNVELHAELAALRLRARKDDPNLLADLAKAPVLPWRDAFFHNRAVFTIQTMADGRIAVTYGAIQSFNLESSEAFGAAMRALPKEMQHGGTLFLRPDDIVIVNDVDGNRQVPLTAADLVAFEHSGSRGLIKHMGNVASVAIPVGLAARGTIGVGQAALEVGGALLTMAAEEYRMELTKWSPGLIAAIDIANVALALKGGVDVARLGKTGVGAVYGRLKREYDLFKTNRAAKMAASGNTNAIHAAQIADAQAQALLRDLEQIQSGAAPMARPPGPTTPHGSLPSGAEPYGLLPPGPEPFGLLTAGPAAPGGPLIVDLQGGPMVSELGPSFLASRVRQTPGARGVAIEPGDYVLAYSGITPTGQRDLNFSRMLVQNLPEWPAGPGPVIDWPQWRFNPEARFPKSGDVRVLQGSAAAGRTPVPEAFFPPVSQSGRALPENLRDVAGLTPTTHPVLHGQVDQLFWRRPFGLGRADAAAIESLGREFDTMLKPGGFVEFRVLQASDAQAARKIAEKMPGARVVEVPQKAIGSYAESLAAGAPVRPGGLSEEQWSILQAAGPDIQGQHGALGQGLFNRIIRVYKPASP